MKMNVRLAVAVLMVNLHVMTVPVYQVVGNAMYTGVIVVDVKMRLIVVAEVLTVLNHSGLTNIMLRS
jgi:hypothetical protein